MEATQLFSSPMLSRRPFSRRKNKDGLAVVVKARQEGLNGGNYWGHTVDENMIVLRMRIKEMELLERSHNDEPCLDWMDWEKKYYVHYHADVCVAMGLLQNYLMNVRPSLGIGTLAVLTFSVLLSAGVVLGHALEISKEITSGFHFHLS